MQRQILARILFSICHVGHMAHAAAHSRVCEAAMYLRPWYEHKGGHDYNIDLCLLV